MNFMDAAFWNKRAIGGPFASPRRQRKFNQIYGRLLMAIAQSVSERPKSGRFTAPQST
jgi:hypothetical protein